MDWTDDVITVRDLIRDLEDNFSSDNLVLMDGSGLTIFDTDSEAKYGLSLHHVDHVSVGLDGIPGSSYNPITGVATIGGKKFKEVPK